VFSRFNCLFGVVGAKEGSKSNMNRASSNKGFSFPLGDKSFLMPIPRLLAAFLKLGDTRYVDNYGFSFLGPLAFNSFNFSATLIIAVMKVLGFG
jgi:hypothetical protein